MDLGGCGGVLSNGFLIHILRPELPVSVCTGVCLLYLFIPPIVSSTVESSSVQLRTRWNVPQCTNMGCALLCLPLPPSKLTLSLSLAPPSSPPLPFATQHPPSQARFVRGRLKRKLCWEIVSARNPADNAEFLAGNNQDFVAAFPPSSSFAEAKNRRRFLRNSDFQSSIPRYR